MCKHMYVCVYACRPAPPASLTLQVIDESEYQTLSAHRVFPTVSTGDMSTSPNALPSTVTRTSCSAGGENAGCSPGLTRCGRARSYVSACDDVPGCPATVTATGSWRSHPPATRIAKLESESHRVSSAPVAPDLCCTDPSWAPKLRPCSCRTSGRLYLYVCVCTYI